ncbi:hypothetical protein CEXT_358891 [Caerostris extrusa]|uniref:Uncharacterized protein n=1 Tax=Caerostris extrusa TaxID=172846 RepID=A0AAV4THK7_CAEEX|nr:hypothetical protein CEXT_358891 [Caerostris extrusa]
MQPPMTNNALHKKELPKTSTLAHQHLLKLMNEFLLCLQQLPNDMLGKASEKVEGSMATSNSRVSDGDMIHGAESTTDEVESYHQRCWRLLIFCRVNQRKRKKNLSLMSVTK